MMRSEYLLLLENAVLIDCCDLRKRELEKDWHVEVLAYGENIAEPSRHCHWSPCLKAENMETCAYCGKQGHEMANCPTLRPSLRGL